jgi:hypothetical protein
MDGVRPVTRSDNFFTPQTYVHRVPRQTGPPQLSPLVQNAYKSQKIRAGPCVRTGSSSRGAPPTA